MCISMTAHVFLISKPPLAGGKATTLKQSNTSEGKVHKKEIVHGLFRDQAVLLPFCFGVLFFTPPPPKKLLVASYP